MYYLCSVCLKFKGILGINFSSFECNSCTVLHGKTIPNMAAVDLNGSWNHSWRAALSLLIVLGYRTVVFLGVLHGLRYLQHCTITTLEKAVFFTDACLVIYITSVL